MGPRQPTIHDVAASSGLSRGTVSRHLNGGKNVSPTAAAAIEQAIRETGYRVNGHARSLRSNKSDTVAFLMPQDMELLFNDPVHAILARECSRALSQRGMAMVMLMAGTPAERERASSYILAGHVDGVFVVGIGPEDGPLHALAGAGIPVVACDHQPIGEPGYSTVSSDSRSAFRDTVAALQQAGRRRIAFLGGTSELDETDLRYQGYREAVGADLDPALVAIPQGGIGQAQTSMRELIERTTFDALVCVNDVAAAAALFELERAGRRVPQDVAVVGFDDVAPICTTTRPQLTSVAQDFTGIADRMAAQLAALMAGDQPTHVDVATQLVRRESF